MSLRIRIDALNTLLIAKGIITKDEYREALDLIRNKYEDELILIEFSARFERINESGMYVDSDVEFFKEHFEECKDLVGMDNMDDFLESISYLYKHSNYRVVDDTLWD
jgi:spore maturation protein CgeB